MLFYSPWRLLFLRFTSSTIMKTLHAHTTLYIRSFPRTFIRPHFGVPPSHVRFLLPALLSAPNTMFYHTTGIVIISYHQKV